MIFVTACKTNGRKPTNGCEWGRYIWGEPNDASVASIKLLRNIKNHNDKWKLLCNGGKPPTKTNEGEP
jgi:hypothetical protein